MTRNEREVLDNLKQQYLYIHSLKKKGTRSVVVDACWEMLLEVMWPEHPHGKPLLEVPK